MLEWGYGLRCWDGVRGEGWCVGRKRQYEHWHWTSNRRASGGIMAWLLAMATHVTLAAVFHGPELNLERVDDFIDHFKVN